MGKVGLLARIGLIVLTLLSIHAATITAQAANPITWAQIFSGTGNDYTSSVQQTSDGGFIVAGQTTSFGATGNRHAWVFRLDSNGNMIWQKTYGGTGFDDAFSVRRTVDGGFVVAGDSASFNGGGNMQAWVFKLDSMGNVVWQNTYGGGQESANSVEQTSDGGFIVAGSGTFSGSGSDVWVFKLDSIGNVVWQKAYGGTATDSASSIRQTSDGGFIVAGETHSFGSMGTCATGPCFHAWVLRLDATGNVAWQKTYGGTQKDDASSVWQTSDGGFVVVGSTSSFGAVGACFSGPCPHAWVFRLDGMGNMVWQNAYGGNGIDSANSVQQTSDGGFIVSGSHAPGTGTSAPWVSKLDSMGNVVWQNMYGTSGSGNSLQERSDGGFIVVGNIILSGNYHALVLKLDTGGSIGFGCTLIASANATTTITTATNTATAGNSANTSAPVAAVTATVTDTTAGTSLLCPGGSVGGRTLPNDRLGIFILYLGLTAVLIIATAASAIYLTGMSKRTRAFSEMHL